MSKLGSFIGQCNVCCKFVPNFARLASPLNKKKKKGERQGFNLDDTECKAVNVLKKKLINQRVLTLPRLNDQYTIDTDAS